jgi:branched-subunit amino acid transport protein
MTYSDGQIWLIILCLAVGTFSLRFVFLGLVGEKQMPPWLLRHLRYTAVAVMPGLIAPLVLWPAATDGQTDPARLAAAAVALAVGVITKSVIFSIISGIGTLYAVQFLLA